MISWVKIEIVKLYHERHVIHNSFSNVIPGRHTLPDSALAARFRGLSHDVWDTKYSWSKTRDGFGRNVRQPVRRMSVRGGAVNHFFYKLPV